MPPVPVVSQQHHRPTLPHGALIEREFAIVLAPFRPANTGTSNAPDCSKARSFRPRSAAAGSGQRLVWVCIGLPALASPPFPEQEDGTLRTVLCGPYPVHAYGPRIIENFLDMAHFPFIHNGILGDPRHTEVPDYEVGPYDDGLGAEGMEGVIATGCRAYQPQANLMASDGSMVEYTYRKVRHRCGGDVDVRVVRRGEKADDGIDALRFALTRPDGLACRMRLAARDETEFGRQVG